MKIVANTVQWVMIPVIFFIRGLDLKALMIVLLFLQISVSFITLTEKEFLARGGFQWYPSQSCGLPTITHSPANNRRRLRIVVDRDDTLRIDTTQDNQP